MIYIIMKERESERIEPNKPTLIPFEYLITFYFFFVLIFIVLCITFWNTDTEVKEYTVAEIENIIDENYIKQKEKASCNAKSCDYGIGMLNELQTEAKENNYGDSFIYSIDSIIFEKKKEKELYESFSRKDTIVVFDNKSFERDSSFFAIGIGLIMIILILFYGYEIIKIMKENWNE